MIVMYTCIDILCALGAAMTDIEKLTKQVKALSSEIRTLKAMISQLGPVEVKTTIEQEFEAMNRQGLNIHEKISYLQQMSKASRG